MSVTNGERLATKQDLADMYQGILPYLGGMPEVVANKFSKGDLYDTSEKMIGKWIDNKPLYQKSISASTPSTNAWTTIVSLGTVCDIEYVEGMFTKTSNGQKFPIGLSTAMLGRFNIIVNYPSVGDVSVSNEEAGSVIVTIKYTKTTDSAISIGSDTDYSTEEKIVGTWIDGEPVYQKTIQLPSKVTTTSSGWTTLADVSSLNIGLVIRTDLVDVTDNMTLTGNLVTVVSGSLRVSTVGYTFPCEIVTIQYTKTTT